MITYIENFGYQLFVLLNEMSVYLLFGFLLAGVLHVFFPKPLIEKYLGKNNFWSVLNAAILGVPLPLCSCGVIPTGVSFQKNGASKAATVSFLISTPQTGVDSILVTYSLLGLPFAIIRPIVAFATGILGGSLTAYVEKRNKSSEIKQETCELPEENVGNKFVRMLKYGFVTFLQDLSKWLIIGILIAALIAVVVPDNFLVQYMTNPFLEMLLILVVSIPLYVCATGSVPIAAVLMLKGLSPGAALVFLMAGPATNAATIAVIGKTLGKKTLIIYLLAIISGAVITGLCINYFLPAQWFMLIDSTDLMHLQHGHESHEILPAWLKIASTISLIALIINGYIVKYLQKKKYKQNIINNNVMNITKISVQGMSCNHCKMNVEKNLAKIQGVKTINVDLAKNTVLIEGDVDMQLIAQTINELGYEFKGQIN